jgi:cephalosporin hydroxylase
LRFFHPHLKSGDYIVIEDGVVGALPSEEYRRYEDGPNRVAVRDFLAECANCFVIDTDLCDFYGHNVTYNPNAWLRKL